LNCASKFVAAGQRMVHPPPILAVSGNASEGGPFAAAWNEAAKMSRRNAR
jgi:hypothetical protein